MRRCSQILLQAVPKELSIEEIRNNICRIEGVVSTHDLHVWQLVDGMLIASVHVGIQDGVEFSPLVNEVKSIFHRYGVHSITIQPEFLPRNSGTSQFCNQNCVKECEEDWCCKSGADNHHSGVHMGVTV